MEEPRTDSHARPRPNGGDAHDGPGGTLVDAVQVLDRVETATMDFVTASLVRVIGAARDLSVRQVEAIAAVGAASFEAAERVGCKATSGAASVGDAVIASLGGLFRKLIVTAGDTARIALEQSSETAHQFLDTGRDVLERTLEATSSVGEASARFAERLVVRALDAAAEMSGALRGTLWGEPGGAARSGSSSHADGIVTVPS